MADQVVTEDEVRSEDGKSDSTGLELAARPNGPSMLDLIHLARRPLLPPGGRDLYRQIGLLAGLREGAEVLDVACGVGVALEYLVSEFGVHGSGVDVDPERIETAQDRLRGSEWADRINLQPAPPHRLPYRDGIFDAVVGELGLTATDAPEQAIQEMVRVTRPGGVIVLVQLVWKAPIPSHRREMLVEYLGIRPLMLVEWKRLLGEAGVTRLHTEDWSDEETAFRPQVRKPFPDFAELFSISEKVGIFMRARRRWGWSGVKRAIAREREVHKTLTHERILGLDLVKGVKTAPLSDAPSSQEVIANETPDHHGLPEQASILDADAQGPEPVADGSEASTTAPTAKASRPEVTETEEASREGPEDTDAIDGLPLFDGS